MKKTRNSVIQFHSQMHFFNYFNTFSENRIKFIWSMWCFFLPGFDCGVNVDHKALQMINILNLTN